MSWMSNKLMQGFASAKHYHVSTWYNANGDLFTNWIYLSYKMENAYAFMGILKKLIIF